jgi:hypothetical protein
VGQLDLKRIARTAHVLEIDRLQDPGGEALEATRQIANVYAEHLAGVPASASARDPARDAPRGDLASGDVTRTECQISVAVSHSRQQAGQVAWVVGAVGVDLHHISGAVRERVPEPGHVRAAEAFALLAVEDRYACVPCGHEVGHHPGAIGRIVVDDQHAEAFG